MREVDSSGVVRVGVRVHQIRDDPRAFHNFEYPLREDEIVTGHHSFFPCGD
jgi:hypothetical protein